MTLPTQISPTESEPGLPWTFGFSAFLCLLLAVAARLFYLAEPFNNDAGVYVLFGKTVWTHGRLYQDFWDTKLPSVGLLMAPIYGLFGSHWWAYVVLQTVLGIAAATALALAVKWYVADWAFRPALLYGLLGINCARMLVTGFQLETLQIFFEVSAAFWVLRSMNRSGWEQVFLAGVLTGIAAMPKPSGLAVGCAARAAYLFECRQIGVLRGFTRIGIFGLGVAMPVGIVWLWVRQQPWRVEVPFVLRQIGLYGSGTPWQRVVEPRALFFLSLPFYPLAIRWVLIQCGARRFPIKPVSVAVIIFAVAWCEAELAAVVLQKRMYSYHALVVFPAAVLLFSIVQRTALRPVLVSLLPIAGISLAQCATESRHFKPPHRMPISDYIVKHTAPDDCIWADPTPNEMLIETDRPPGARLTMFYLINHDAAPQLFRKILLDDLETRRPKYIILPKRWHDSVRAVAYSENWLRWRPQRRQEYLRECDIVEQYIKTHYTAEADIDGEVAWRRTDP